MRKMKPDKLERLSLSIFLFAGALFLFSSCAYFQFLKFPTSDEYIIYELQKGDTPAILAEKFLGDKKKLWIIEDANEDVRFEVNDIVVIPLKEKNKVGLQGNTFQAVPILCYHRFSSNSVGNLNIPPDNFYKQMKYLKENGYRVISLSQLFDFLECRHAIPNKAVVITIDDGFRSAYDVAYPILKKYGFSATQFVYTEFIGSCKNALTWSQMREMKKNGFEIGSHSVSHMDLTDDKKFENRDEYLAAVENELRISKEIIDKELGQDTIFLSYPYGQSNIDVVRIARRLGYKLGLTVKKGRNPFFANNFKLSRTMVLKSDIESFRLALKTTVTVEEALTLNKSCR